VLLAPARGGRSEA